MDITKRFSFAQYKEAFEYFEKFKENAQLVISTHWASEGYWVEPIGTKVSDISVDFIYKNNEVENLKNRVERKIKSGKVNGLIL